MQQGLIAVGLAGRVATGNEHKHASTLLVIPRPAPPYVTTSQHTSRYVSIRQHTSGYVRIRQDTSAHASDWQVARRYVAPRYSLLTVQHTWPSLLSRYCLVTVSLSCHSPTYAYVSIRQHTSAYVSIRQHTSAYVSIHQHTSHTPALLRSAFCSSIHGICSLFFSHFFSLFFLALHAMAPSNALFYF
jgi:hypothetical protein